MENKEHEINRCKRCNRKLNTWNSIQKGYGPICEKIILAETEKQQIRIKE